MRPPTGEGERRPNRAASAESASHRGARADARVAEREPNGAGSDARAAERRTNSAGSADSASGRRPNRTRPADTRPPHARAAPARLPRASERGQATVELLGGLPALLLLGTVILQALAVGYASVLAGNAAEAGALALAGGGDARAGVRASLPGWSRSRARVSVRSGWVNVRLRPPSPLRAVSRRLEVSSTAVVTGP